MNQIRNSSIDRLFQIIMNLESVDDCYDFFGDVCTVKELQDMAQRLDTAFLLDSGMSYQNITKRIGVSAATIGRVSRCLNYGAGGYRKAIEAAKKDNRVKK
ncbi:MAG: YerC/YecD family TrpR-related protein [Lachnospiraceae bacterium]